MDAIQSLFEILHSYIEIGGITMYPLILCCVWMWAKIMYHLPLWQRDFSLEKEEFCKEFSALGGGSKRHRTHTISKLWDKYSAKERRGIKTIKVLAMLAPFLGLFGTVTGMINTFESVALFGLANPKALAGGISEAMVTTQFGLLIAVPGILAVYFLQRRITGRARRLEHETAHLICGEKL